MAFALSPRMKGAVDAALGLLGGFLGLLAANAAQFGDKAPMVSIVGVIGGYAVSDVLSFVDTGVAPSAATVATQVQAAYAQAKPLIQAEIGKLPSGDQAIANAALVTLEAELAKAAGQ